MVLLPSLSRREAEETIDAISRGRRDFCMRYFNQDINNPHHCGLVLNIERISPDAAVEHVFQAYREIHGEPVLDLATAGD